MNDTTLTNPSEPLPRRHTSRILILLVAVVALIAAACSSEGDDSASADTAASSTPTTAVSTTAALVEGDHGEVLPPGTHVGISWFAPPVPGTEEQVFALWEEANADATVGRVHIDWIDVEPAEGEYVFDDLEEQLAAISGRGALPMVTIVAVDVSGTPFPEWLGGFEPERAAEAYARMLEAAAPMLEEHGVWLVAVANEPPLEEGLDTEEFTRFVAGVEERADTIIPDIPISFTFAGGDALKRDDATRALADVVDVFGVNHYCISDGFLAIDSSEIESHMAESMVLAGDKPVVFQEFGCPASEFLGSSEEFQAAWFDEAFDLIRADDQVVAAFVFEFGNWSEELLELDYGAAFDADPGLQAVYDQLFEWLGTSGLIRPDATPRPAWDVYLANLGG